MTVAGYRGRVPARLHARLTGDPLSIDAARASVADAEAGAVALFAGTVRAQADGRAVTGLTYEAYEERAAAQLAALAAAAAARWPALCAVWVEHRTGALSVGEVAVVVAVSSPHRAEAFDACRWVIEELKADAAIWKQEHWAAGGARWVGVE